MQRVDHFRRTQQWRGDFRYARGTTDTGNVPAKAHAVSGVTSPNAPSDTSADRPGEMSWKTLLMGAALLMAACPPGVAARARPSRDASSMPRATEVMTGGSGEVVTTATPGVTSTSPVSPQHPAIDSESPAVSSPAPLDDTWLTSGDLSAFLDGPPFADFVATFGNGAQPGNTRASFLFSLYQALDPQEITGVSPWDASNFNRTATDAFGKDVRAIDALLQRLGMASGYGSHAASQQDPAFQQQMLIRLMRIVFFPDLRAGNDQLPEPVRTEWLTWLHPGFRNASCTAEDEARVFDAPDTDRLLVRLGDAVFGEESADLGDAKPWVYRLLGAMVDPALVAHSGELPWRAGTLPWALQRIGMRMAGPDAWRLSAPELATLATTTYLTALDTSVDAATAFFHANADILLLFAHGTGTVDLRDGEALANIAIKDAIGLFHLQMRNTFGHDHPGWLDALTDLVPHRAAYLKRELDRMLPDDANRIFYSAGWPKFPPLAAESIIDFVTELLRTVLGDAFEGCMPSGDAFTLAHLLLDDCMADIERADPALAQRIRDAKLDPKSLNERFATTLDESVAHLRDTVLLPALDTLGQTLSADDQPFWTCGDWRLRVPRIHATNLNDAQATGFDAFSVVGQITKHVRPPGEVEASQLVFIELTLDDEIRHYAISFTPLNVTRFSGNAEDWLAAHPETLFSGARYADLQRERDDIAMHRTLTPTHDGNFRVAQALATAFSERLGAVRAGAFDKTTTQAHREAVREMLLNFVPFYGCHDQLAAGDIDAAALRCSMDVAAAIPLASAAVVAQKATWRASRILVRAALDDVAHGVTRRAGLSGAARVVPHLLATPEVLAAVDIANLRLADTGLAALRFVDPGFELATRATLHLPAFARRLSDNLRGMKFVSRAAGTWAREAETEATFVHHAGVWQVPHAEGEAFHLKPPAPDRDATALALTDWNAHGKAVVRREGHWARLVNPYSGKTYGPPLASDEHGKIVGPIPTPRTARDDTLSPALQVDGSRASGVPEACPPPPASPSSGTSRRRRALPKGIGACGVLSKIRGPKSLIVTPLYSRPPALRRFDAEAKEWRDVDANDVAALIAEVTWPVPGARDEYFLKGDHVFWRATTAGVRQPEQFAGKLPQLPEIVGVAYPKSGFVRVDISVNLDLLSEPLHLARRCELYLARATTPGGSRIPSAPETSDHGGKGQKGRPHRPESAFLMKAALPYSEMLPQGPADAAVILLGTTAYRFPVIRTAGRSQPPYGVTLELMTMGDLEEFRRFQTDLHSELNARWIGETQMLGSLREMNSPRLESQFDRILTRAESLLSGARLALGSDLVPAVSDLLERFAPENAEALVNALKPVLEQMHAGLMSVSKHRGTALGIMESAYGALAQTLVGVLGRPEYAANLPRPVIGFETSALAALSDEVLASVLLHEISHATVATRDVLPDGRRMYASMLAALRTQQELPSIGNHPPDAIGEYGYPPDVLTRADTPRYQFMVRDHMVYDGLRMDIADMLDQQGDNAVRNIVQHADTLTHLITTLAYARDPDQFGRVAGIVRGESTTYQRYTPSHTPWGHRTSPHA
ncbi:hypothetical protein PIN31009_03637 [Pandoraea iniqua]|nr:hypothetical protein PIN31009_03637 [Pandoraea iniqua]